jgi:hypothetical protein
MLDGNTTVNYMGDVANLLEPMGMLLCNELITNYCISPISGITQFPYNFEIDYIRIWQRPISSNVLAYCTPALPPPTYFGQNELNLGQQNLCNGSVFPTNTWTFLPNKSAVLWDGVEFNNNAANEVYINDLGCP